MGIASGHLGQRGRGLSDPGRGNNGPVAWRPPDPNRSTGGPAPGDPDRRALDAMAAAVRRARRGPVEGEPRPTEPLSTESTTWHLSEASARPLTTAEVPTATNASGSSENALTPERGTRPAADRPRSGRARADRKDAARAKAEGAKDEGATAEGTKAEGTELLVFDDLAPPAGDRRPAAVDRPGSRPPQANQPTAPDATADSTDTATTFGVEAEAALAGLPGFDPGLPVIDVALPDVDHIEQTQPGSGPPGRHWPSDAAALAAARPDRIARPPAREPRRARTLPSRHAVEVAVVSVSVAILLAGGLAAGLSLSGSTPSSPARSGAGAASSAGSPGPGHGGSNTDAAPSGKSGSVSHPKKGATTSGSSVTTAPTRTGSAGAGGSPHLQSVKPAAGAPGQAVTLTGSDLYSASGEITAYIGGAAAPTSCSSQTSCTVTVPDLGRPHRTTVVIETASGSSNTVAFDYT